MNNERLGLPKSWTRERLWVPNLGDPVSDSLYMSPVRPKHGWQIVAAQRARLRELFRQYGTVETSQLMAAFPELEPANSLPELVHGVADVAPPLVKALRQIGRRQVTDSLLSSIEESSSPDMWLQTALGMRFRMLSSGARLPRRNTVRPQGLTAAS